MQVFHAAAVIVARHALETVVPAGVYGDAKRLVAPRQATFSNNADGIPVLPIADIAAMREIALLTISRWKQETQDAGFTFGGKLYDSDLRSRLSISGAVQMAQLALAASQPFAIDWASADNTETPMDAQTVIAFGQAAGQAFTGAHDAALTHKATITSADTVEEIIAVLTAVGAW